MSRDATTDLARRQEQMLQALRDAADECDGHVTTLAGLLGCSPQWLYKNARRGEFTPELAKALEDVTGIPRARFNARVFS